MASHIGRRKFLAALGGAAAAWPLAARAQQPVMPVIGFLISRGPGDTPQLLAAFRQGLKDAGFIERQNVAIEYRFADNQNERLPALAADLVQRQVTAIVAITTPAALAARRRPQRFRLYLRGPSTQSRLAWSSASTGLAVTQQA